MIKMLKLQGKRKKSNLGAQLGHGLVSCAPKKMDEPNPWPPVCQYQIALEAHNCIFAETDPKQEGYNKEVPFKQYLYGEEGVFDAINLV
ncbi:hypothetical protein K1719_034650 [Acacia pycnantha]|nr:hypothetical protein K1719_034650 [Acacia pycnantha]